jgi:hypothetical protein
MTEAKKESANQGPCKALVSTPVCHTNAAACVSKLFGEAASNYYKYL